MRSIKKIIVIIIIAFTLALSGCSKGLDKPINLKIDNKANRLDWDNVGGADEYIVSINDTKYQAEENYFSLDRLSLGDFVLKVMAVNGGNKSEWSDPITLSYDPTTLLVYSKIDGYDEYAVSGIGRYSNSHLIIPDTYNNMPVTRIKAEAFMGYNTIEEVTLGKNIRVVEKNAFRDIPSLKRLNLNEGLEIVEESAFQGALLLEELILPNTVSSLGEAAFAYNKSIEKLVLSNSLSIINNKVFSDLTSLKSLTIPNSVLEIGDFAFSRAIKLQSLKLPKGLAKIGKQAFYESKSLDKVEIPGSVKVISEFSFAKSGLKSLVINEGTEEILKQAFYECDNLIDISLPKSLRVIESFSFDETKLVKQSEESVYVGNWLIKAKALDAEELIIKEDTIGIAGSAIRDNNYLKSVVLPNSLRYIGEYNFYKMKKLSSLNLADTKIEYILEGSIYDCLQLDISKLPKSLKYIGRNVFRKTIVATLADNMIKVDGWLIGAMNNNISEIIIEDDIIGIASHAFDSFIKVKRIDFQNATSLKYINDTAFNSLNEVVRLDLPDSIIEIGEYAFSNLKKLEYLKLPKNLKIIEKSTFNGALRLRVVELPESLEEIRNYAFYNAAIRSLSMPKSLKYIGIGAFYSNPDLETLELNEGLEVIDCYAFSKAISLYSLKMPKSLKRINDHAFFGAKSLESLNLGGSLYVGDYAFYDSISLKSIDFGDTEYIGEYAFSNNNSIESLLLANSIKIIGKNAFMGFNKLKNVILGDNLKYIGDYAFERNSSITFYLEGSIEEKRFSKLWNSKFRPVIDNIELSSDRSFVVSFRVNDSILNLNEFIEIELPTRKGYRATGFKNLAGEIISLESLGEIKNTDLTVIYEKL